MRLQSEIQAALRQGRAEQEAERGVSERFRREWADKREKLWPLFGDAVGAILDERIGAFREMVDGGVRLHAGGHDLTFAPRDLHVVCSSTIPGDISEAFTPGAIDAVVVTEKIRRFAYGLAKEVVKGS